MSSFAKADKNEIKRAIREIFGITKKEKISEPILAAASRIIADTLKKRGIDVMVRYEGDYEKEVYPDFDPEKHLVDSDYLARLESVLKAAEEHVANWPKEIPEDGISIFESCNLHLSPYYKPIDHLSLVEAIAAAKSERKE